MKDQEPVLAKSEIVFMSAANADAYRAYGATFVGWGGSHTAEQVKLHHDLGIRCTGSMWCLTAGAKPCYESPALRDAVSRDIEGKPVAVPWLFDHTYQGMQTYFGCIHHPAFREHVRQQVREVMRGGADGLHVDDHSASAMSARLFGGGLCDHCIEAFRKYLVEQGDPGQLKAAGIGDLKRFDYRDVIRKYGTTRAAYLQVQNQIPLMDLFLHFHSEAAAENVRQLGELAAEVAGHPILLSANACLPDKSQTYVLKHLTHIICEVDHQATCGTARRDIAIAAYAVAEKYGKPLAGTASGADWDYVKAHQCEALVRFWIALAYAHGQRFMVPHPTRQWCFSQTLGTHWYQAPIGAYAPLYQFIRAHRDCFDGFETGSMEGATVPEHVHCTLRRQAAGKTVVHVLNTDYDPESKAMRAKTNVRIRLRKEQAGATARTATLFSYDAGPQVAPIIDQGDGRIEIELPSLRLWTLALLGAA